MSEAIHGNHEKGFISGAIQSLALGLALAGLVAAPVAAEDVGALIEFQPQTKALAADVNQNFDDVKTAVNSKTTNGIEFATSDSSLTIADTSATPTTALTVTLTAPSTGFVKVDFSSYMTIGHTTGANSYVVCAIKTNDTSPDASTGRLAGSRRFVVVLSHEASATYYPHIDTMGVFQVPTAGSYTFNVNCYRSASASSATLVYRTLTAEFHSDRF